MWDYITEQQIKELKAQKLNQSQIAAKLGTNVRAISKYSKIYGIKWDTGAAARDQTGSKNPAYVDGLSKSNVERLTRKIVIENNRCLYTCDRCGNHNKFQEQHRHHKDRDRSNNTNENIEVLCNSCHTVEHHKDRVRDPQTGRWIA